MPPQLVDPATGVLFETALTELLGVLKIISSSKRGGKELKEKVQSIKPIIDEIFRNITASDRLRPYVPNDFQAFQVTLQEGLDLAEAMENISRFNVFTRYRYGKKICEFQRKVCDFLHNQVPLHTALEVQKLDGNFRTLLQRFENDIKNYINEMSNKSNSNTTVYGQSFITGVYPTSSDLRDETTAVQQGISCASHLPDGPKFVVGLTDHIKDVKQILFQNDVNVVALAGMGGSGKTTLASVVCKDTDVIDFFENNIIFVKVSRLDNVHDISEILKVMWNKLIGGQIPRFSTIEDAHTELKKKLKLRGNRPTLVVLDDCWSTSSLEPLLFEAEGYKTLVTTRQDDTIRITDSTRRLYKMDILEAADALSLFCLWAFDQPSIPAPANKNLVEQVVAECRGLPLALKVIGSSLRGEPRPVWQSAKEKLSRGEYISVSHRYDLFHLLETSIDVLDDLSKECFLDLGVFPEGKKFSVDSLLDIWVYVRKLEWNDAFVILLELAKRNLIQLTGSLRSCALDYCCSSELFFSQHGIMRDLALRLASQKNIINRERLFMPYKDNNIPKEWLRTLKNQSSGARVLSIHTGAMQEQDWCQIHFPEVEALALIFEAEQYCLPAFLQTMPKLKVLILYNYSSECATLSGLPSFPSTVQIKSLFLNKLHVPPLYKNCSPLEVQEKLSLSLCEGLGNMIRFHSAAGALKFPNITDFNLDHCADLEELPDSVCTLTSLERWSVTNCHLLKKLPDDLGSLTSLRMLRLSACLGLRELPKSIGNLGKLEYLDISLCESLKELPSEFDKLSNLETLDIRHYSGLKKLPNFKLKSLKRAIISDPEIEGEWLSNPNLTVEVRRFSSDWSDDESPPKTKKGRL